MDHLRIEHTFSTNTIVRYLISLEFRKKRNLIGAKETLISTGEWKFLLLEMFVCLVGPNPFVLGIIYEFSTMYDNLDVYMHINEVLCLFVFSRAFIILRVVLMNSRYNSNRSQRICEMYACEPGYLFTIKCIMQAEPFKVIGLSMLFSIPIFGYLLRICERPIARVPNQPFSYDAYANAVWNVVVTITTVGYGDYYVRTFLGRFIVFFVCMWGVFIISMMVITLSNALNLTGLEVKAYTVFQKLMYKEELKEKAAHIITSLVKAKLHQKRQKTIKNPYISKIKGHLKNFGTLQRQYKEEGCDAANGEELMRHFELLKDSTRQMTKQQNYLMEANKIMMGMLGVDKAAIEKLNDLLKSENNQTTIAEFSPQEIEHEDQNLDQNLINTSQEVLSMNGKQAPY